MMFLIHSQQNGVKMVFGPFSTINRQLFEMVCFIFILNIYFLIRQTEMFKIWHKKNKKWLEGSSYIFSDYSQNFLICDVFIKLRLINMEKTEYDPLATDNLWATT